MTGYRRSLKYDSFAFEHSFRFKALVTLDCRPGAYACNIKGESLSVADFLQAVSKVTGKDVCPITDDAITLPFPDVFDEKLLADLLGRPAHVTTLEDAVQETVDHFRSLKEDGKFWHTNDLN